MTKKGRKLLHEGTSGVLELFLHDIVMVETEIYAFVKIHRTVTKNEFYNIQILKVNQNIHTMHY